MTNKLHHLATYFNSRAKTNSNSCYANGYSTDMNELSYFYDQVTEELIHLLSLKESNSFLEIGCGTGEILSRIKKQGTKTQGIDISHEMVALAKKKGLDVTYYNGQVLPFKDATFDVVLLYQVITNIPTQQAVKALIKEANRILKTSGRLFIGAVADPRLTNFPQHTDMNLRSIYNRIRSWFGGSHAIGYFSYSHLFFLKLYQDLNFNNLTFSRCTLSRPGWENKYHIMMEKQ